MADRFEIGDHHARFILAERWDDAPMIGWLGMNPSYAGAARTDHTWTAWRKLAVRWGFGGQIVGNPVPLRSADPDEAIRILRDVAAGTNPQAAAQMAANLVHLQEHAARPVAWVVGWGDKGAAMNDVVRCHRKTLDALSAGGARTFLALGLTASHNPKHVLARGKSRVPDDVQPREWRPTRRDLGPVADLAALRAG